MTVAQHSARTFDPEPRPGWFARLREWWRSTDAPTRDDWTEPLKEPARPEPRPTHTIPQQRPAQPPQQVQPQRPPLALPPRPAAHTLAWMVHRLADLLADPNLTATKAIEALRDPNVELSRMFQVEQEVAQQAADTRATLARRSARNAEAAAAAAHGLEVALQTPGVRVDTATTGDGEFVPDLGARMVEQAAHASDTTVQTGLMPRITDDMPDPRTVAQPVDVNPGDVEPAASPVHEDGAPAIPEPTAAFLGGSGEFALPKREPQSPLAHEVPDAAPTAVLPVQGDKTEVMPVFAGAGVADPSEGVRDDD